MIQNKLILFIVHGKIVEEIEGSEIDHNGVENMKTNLAIMHGVSFDDVEMDTKDIHIPELSELFVRDDGALMWKKKFLTHPVYVDRVRPAMDVNHEELFLEFLDLIAKKDFDNAITFL